MPALTDEQRIAHDVLLKYLTGQDKTYAMMVLKGYAGTGKTFTLAQIVAVLRTMNNTSEDMFSGTKFRIAMSAPTNKAVRVLKNFSRNMAGVTFATIHSLLGLKEIIDDNGRQRFEQDKDPDKIRIEQFNILFIDEVSMLSDDLFKLLLPYLKRGLKLVFVGDPKQIPPVNHIDSIPLIEKHQATYNIGVVTLETIMRQAMDNPILAYATRIRKAEATTSDFPVETHLVSEAREPSRGIIALKSDSEEAIRGIIRDYFDVEAFRQDADYMKIICWKNMTVAAFNKIIRGQLYKDAKLPEGCIELPSVMVGEKLIVDKPVMLSGNKVLLTTNEEIEILRYEVKQKDVEYMGADLVDRQWEGKRETTAVTYYNTWVRYFDEDGIEAECNIHILHEDHQAKMNGITQKIASTAKAMPPGLPLRGKLWQNFYATQRLFAAVKYNYAITGHKSQGSTYGNCMVIDWDIATNPNIAERNRIRYVAVTRARSLLFIVK